ncbi:hypothetical protein JL720_5340 [Aureococcus anophagefferens]|nr:hypothetical protein JL720_5340 [Aureococcus anophagefferens]
MIPDDDEALASRRLKETGMRQRLRRCLRRCPKGDVLWTEATRRCRWPILVLCLGSLGLAPLAPALLDRTSNAIQLVAGSPSEEAFGKLKATFPGSVSVGSMIVLVEAKRGATLAAHRDTWCAFEDRLSAAIVKDYGGDDFLKGDPEAWCLLTARNATYLAGNLVDAPTATGGLGSSTAATFVVNYKQNADPDKMTAFVTFAQDKVNELAKTVLGLGTFRVGVTGWDCFTVASTAGAQKDLENLDMRSLPLALIVMALTLGSFPMLLIPVLNMACTTVLEFVIMAQVARRMQVAAFAPSVMMTLTLAMSFDYSLFICSRYLEARRDGVADEARVLKVVGGGGTIVVSGSTLVACFLGLLVFPSALLRGIGVCVSVGLCTAMAMNLTLSPALLHVCGERLAASQERFVGWACAKRAAPPSAAGLEAPLLDGTAVDDDDAGSEGTTVVAKKGSGATGADPVMTAPSPSGRSGLVRLGDDFGAGAVAPFTVLFDARGRAGGALDDELLDAVDEYLFGTLAHLGQQLRVVSPTRLGDDRVAVADYAACVAAGTPPKTARCASLLGLLQTSLSASRDAVTATVLLDASPYSPAGFAWVAKARTADASRLKALGVAPYVYGFAGGLKDVIDDLYGNFPGVIAITLGAVFVLLTLSFRSLAVALRSVCALCLTLSFAFGATVMVYQRAAQAGLPAFLTTRTAHPGVSWLAPLLCFTIVVGLALDYDVFLLARVHEYRFADAMDDRSATLEAIERTGLIISAAGLIMAIAFGGLLLSETTILNQAAFILGVSVLFDTFVVRTFLTPALLSLSRGRAWWPSTPPPGLTRDDARALLDDDADGAPSEIIQ